MMARSYTMMKVDLIVEFGFDCLSMMVNSGLICFVRRAVKYVDDDGIVWRRCLSCLSIACGDVDRAQAVTYPRVKLVRRPQCTSCAVLSRGLARPVENNYFDISEASLAALLRTAQPDHVDIHLLAGLCPQCHGHDTINCANKTKQTTAKTTPLFRSCSSISIHPHFPPYLQHNQQTPGSIPTTKTFSYSCYSPPVLHHIHQTSNVQPSPARLPKRATRAPPTVASTVQPTRTQGRLSQDRYHKTQKTQLWRKKDGEDTVE